LIKIQLNRNPGEAQAAESVGDELEILKANGFAEGKPIARLLPVKTHRGAVSLLDKHLCQLVYYSIT
jgi:hypothetical protein